MRPDSNDCISRRMGGEDRWLGERHDGESNETPRPKGLAISPVRPWVLGGLEEGGWYRNGSDEELEAKGEVGKEDQDMMSPKKSLFTTLGPRGTGVDGC